MSVDYCQWHLSGNVYLEGCNGPVIFCWTKVQIHLRHNFIAWLDTYVSAPLVPGMNMDCPSFPGHHMSVWSSSSINCKRKHVNPTRSIMEQELSYLYGTPLDRMEFAVLQISLAQSVGHENRQCWRTRETLAAGQHPGSYGLELMMASLPEKNMDQHPIGWNNIKFIYLQVSQFRFDTKVDWNGLAVEGITFALGSCSLVFWAAKEWQTGQWWQFGQLQATEEIREHRTGTLRFSCFNTVKSFIVIKVAPVPGIPGLFLGLLDFLVSLLLDLDLDLCLGPWQDLWQVRRRFRQGKLRWSILSTRRQFWSMLSQSFRQLGSGFGPWIGPVSRWSRSGRWSRWSRWQGNVTPPLSILEVSTQQGSTTCKWVSRIGRSIAVNVVTDRWWSICVLAGGRVAANAVWHL